MDRLSAACTILQMSLDKERMRDRRYQGSVTKKPRLEFCEIEKFQGIEKSFSICYACQSSHRLVLGKIVF